MAHPFNDNCFRYTFIFKKENLTGSLANELQVYISQYQKGVAEEANKGVTSACDLHVYEETLIIEDEDTRVAPVLVLVFYGSDWMNFIQDLLYFQEMFPSSRLPREVDHSYVLRDESRRFDDFK